MGIVLTMSTPEKGVALQIEVRKQTRKRLGTLAREHEHTMSVLGDAFLEYAMDVFASGKVPPALTAILDKALKEHERFKKNKSE